MEQPKNRCRYFGVWLEAEPALIGSKIVQSLVDDAETDDGINNVGVNAPIEKHTQQYGSEMAQGEQADIEGNLLRGRGKKTTPKRNSR